MWVCFCLVTLADIGSVNTFWKVKYKERFVKYLQYILREPLQFKDSFFLQIFLWYFSMLFTTIMSWQKAPTWSENWSDSFEFYGGWVVSSSLHCQDRVTLWIFRKLTVCTIGRKINIFQNWNFIVEMLAFTSVGAFIFFRRQHNFSHFVCVQKRAEFIS